MKLRNIKYSIIFIFIAAFFHIASAGAQNVTVRGKVVDENNEPAIAVNVMIVGTSNGVSTDENGNYSIKIKKGGKLRFSYIGYKPQTYVITKKRTLDVKLELDANMMEELVLVGYGYQKKSDLTGAVASVSSEKIEGYKSGSVLEAIGGQISGVQITATDGTPGAGFDIKVRGIGSINGDASPMYVVDGFQVDNIDYLANSDIESIEVLKDASSAAIYGARGANGVILVTTKSGKEGRPVINYNGSATYRKISKTLDLMKPYDFVKLQIEGWPDKFSDTYFSDKPGSKYDSIKDYIGMDGVDWQNETFKPTWSQNHDLSVSGGNKDTKYSMSFSNFDENGIFENSSFMKRTAKVRINQKLTKKLRVDASINYSFADKRGVGTSGDNGRFNMLAQILRARPTAGLRMTDEELLAAAIDPLILESSESLSQVNPIVQANSVTQVKKDEMWSANASFTYEIFKNFTFKSAGTYSTTNRRNYTFYQDGSKEAYRHGQKPYGKTVMERKKRWAFQNYLTYKYPKKHGHTFDVMLGQESTGRSSEFLLGESTDFPFDNLGNYNLGLGATPSEVNSGFADQLLVSFFSRVNYSYKNKYLLSATLRADGSTVFSDNNKWGFFPSFSFAWKIKEEPWMKDIREISSMKLRAGWGEVGNDRIKSYLSMNLYEQIKYGRGNEVLTALQIKQLANQDLKWESSRSVNFGLDFGLFHDRLSLTLDVFQKDTKDLLMNANKASVSGFESQWRNVGKIRNRGLELNLRTVNFDKNDFYWSTDFNISFISNELKSIAGDSNSMYAHGNWNNQYSSYDYISMVGGAIGQIYGYKFDGVYQDSDFMVDAATGKYILKDGIVDISEHAGREVVPGMVKYSDIDGDGIITTKDRTIIGRGVPKWYGGITNNFSYKGIDFSFLFQFNYGNDVYNATRMFASQSQDQRSNMMLEVANRWTPTNASKDVPAWDGYIKNELYSRFIEDGSFLRLKNVTLGYTIPRKLTRKIKVKKLRVYASAQNLFVVSNYKGYDPEVSMRASNPMTPSLDWGAYPKSRVYSFGLNLSF